MKTIRESSLVTKLRERLTQAYNEAQEVKNEVSRLKAEREEWKTRCATLEARVDLQDRLIQDMSKRVTLLQ
jgi:predicted nuclease with TOPRIM domain